jgi:hypothetical protein
LPGHDSALLADVRLDRAHHRPVAGDTVIAEQVRLAARAHQSMIWMRQRSTNTLRSLLRECYPAAHTTAQVVALLRKAGRQRNLDKRAEHIVAALRAEQLPVRAELEGVNAATVSALVAVLTTMVAQTAVLEEQVRLGFDQHPDADIYLSQPGLGMILGPGAGRDG